MTEAARRNLEAFQTTSAAREFADDALTWDVVAWSWAPGPPLRVGLRSERGDVVEFQMDEQGGWRVESDRNAPKQPLPH